MPVWDVVIKVCMALTVMISASAIIKAMIDGPGDNEPDEFDSLG